MRKAISIIVFVFIIVSCLVFCWDNNPDETAGKDPEKVIEQNGINYYIDEELAKILLDYRETIADELLSKKIIIIAFSRQKGRHFISFVSSSSYDALLLRNGHFIINDQLILFYGEDSPYFEIFVKTENLEYGIPDNYLNEIADDPLGMIGYRDLINRIWIGENGELIPE